MSDEFFEFITDTFGKENVELCKHRTQAGCFIGWKYFITIPNTRRKEPVEVIEFLDGLYYCGICAWVKEETMKNILLALKQGLEKESK